MRNAVYWFEKSPPRMLASLSGRIEADAVVVGGGTTGLTVAQWLMEHAGLDVVLLEARFCGSGATGRSSGLISPDTELDAHQYTRRFGVQTAEMLMRSAYAGIEQIRSNIERFSISCGYMKADALYVADGRFLVPEIRREHEARTRQSLDSRFYDRDRMPEVLGTDGYHAGVRYGGTFAMSASEYVHGLRDALVERGLRVYENTPAVQIEAHRVRTPMGEVRAKRVFVCVDRYAPELGIEPRDVYHQQSFIVVSEPLDPALRGELFPDGPLLVHDSRLVYHYFRLTPEGRLVLGGGLTRKAYLPSPSDPSAGARYLLRYIRRKFPQLADVEFTHTWPGLFGLSKDLLPIAGRVPHSGTTRDGELYVALCGGGMAWSVLAATTAAQTAIEGSAPLTPFFKPRRAFTPLEPLTAPLLKPVEFELSHLYAKSLLTGMPEQVARRQRRVRVAVWSLAAGGAAAAIAGGLRWLNRH
jgi:gamma-glutamylputrescine oxidase